MISDVFALSECVVYSRLNDTKIVFKNLFKISPNYIQMYSWAAFNLAHPVY